MVGTGRDTSMVYLILSLRVGWYITVFYRHIFFIIHWPPSDSKSSSLLTLASGAFGRCQEKNGTNVAL